MTSPSPFGGAYRGKRVLVTGNTGFKGAWLTTWLLKLGASVVGLAKDVPTSPSLFETAGLDKHISHNVADIRDLETLRTVLLRYRPDFVIHLAAQSIVSRSYSDPAETIGTNVIGTMNVLESLRSVDWPCAAVIITSDKCYDNVEWEWGYRETDRLGGRDIYSGSKGAAELVIRSYVSSFFQEKGGAVRIGVGRAGNVIGGGDWARDRIVVDCVKAWSRNERVEIRQPSATRPWQHVLEPLSGYLTLGASLAQSGAVHGEPFNFGPRSVKNHTVEDLLHDLAREWGYSDAASVLRVTGNVPFHEAGLLKLNCDKALFHLGWEPNLTYDETIKFTGRWYANYYRNGEDPYRFTLEQIELYERFAVERARVWA